MQARPHAHTETQATVSLARLLHHHKYTHTPIRRRLPTRPRTHTRTHASVCVYMRLMVSCARFLSHTYAQVLVFVCSFIPLLGVLLSTMPMGIVALGEYGVHKMAQVPKCVLCVCVRLCSYSVCRCSMQGCLRVRVHVLVQAFSFSNSVRAALHAPYHCERLRVCVGSAFTCLCICARPRTQQTQTYRSVNTPTTQQVWLMVFAVHVFEAYFLNPQIYSSKLKLHPIL